MNTTTFRRLPTTHHSLKGSGGGVGVCQGSKPEEKASPSPPQKRGGEPEQIGAILDRVMEAYGAGPDYRAEVLRRHLERLGVSNG